MTITYIIFFILTTLVHIILIWIYTITIIYLLCFYTFFNIHILRIYHVSYPIILKINVSTYRIRVVLDTRIVSVYHSQKLILESIIWILKSLFHKSYSSKHISKYISYVPKIKKFCSKNYIMKILIRIFFFENFAKNIFFQKKIRIFQKLLF